MNPKNLRAVDMIYVLFHLLLTAVNLAFASSIPGWLFLAVFNIALVLFILFAARNAGEGGGRVWAVLHLFYPAAMITVTYKQIYVLVPAVRPGIYDNVLIAVDRFLFGEDPTVFLFRFAHPVLTEFLQIAYVSFYLLPILLAVALVRRRRFAALDYTAFLIIYGFFLSYMGYFILPAIGPRFSLHDFYAINIELPGILLTNAIRDFVNVGASASSTHPDAARLIQRDVFPSGHTLVTLVSIYLAIRLRTRTRYVMIPVGALLIFSTVYLRYHYVIDIIGGLVFFGLTITTGRLIHDSWQKFRGLPPFRWEGA